MKNTIILTVLIIVLVGAGLYFKKDTKTEVVGGITGPKDVTYVVEGQSVALVNGEATTEIPNSSAKVTTKYFGNEVKHDFDGDGREDVAYIITQNTGGSGTFYYVVAALNTTKGYVGTDTVLLGDRISPQSMEMGQGTKSNVLVVNYANRKPGESFAVAPSVAKSIWLLLDTKTMKWGEVAQNFEGEADPSKMTLTMKTWTWISTTYSDGKVVKPRVEKKFVLTFQDTKRFSASTDCNGVGGEYKVTGDKISFTRMMSTLMYCEGSQEGDFAKMLAETQSYLFTSKGELVLNLKLDSGTVVFR